MSNQEIIEQNNQKLAELTETLSQKALSQVPAGGTTDQILAKASDADYDTTWVDAPSGGEKLYRHTLTLNSTSGTICCTIINNNTNVFTSSSLAQYLIEKGDTYIEASGKINDSANRPMFVYALKGSTSNNTAFIHGNILKCSIEDSNIVMTTSGGNRPLSAITSIYDYVFEI